MRIVDSERDVTTVLLRNARLGNGEALGTLLESLRPWLRLLAYRSIRADLGARLDASDVVQLTCISIHRRIEEFQGDSVARFLAWVKEIHYHNIQDEVRRHLQVEERSISRERTLSGVEPLSSERDSPEWPVELQEYSLLLHTAVQKLPLSQQRVVTMRYLEGKAVAEIALELRVSPDAVTSLLRRGVTALRRQLKGVDP